MKYVNLASLNSGKALSSGKRNDVQCVLVAEDGGGSSTAEVRVEALVNTV